MQPLNAIDAIAPAFTRSNQLLFAKPRKLGRTWKLCATSYLAYLGSMFIPYPLFFLFLPHGAYGPMPGVFFAFMLIPFAVYLALFYCGVRLEFVEFEMVVTRGTKIAPMWNRYGSRTWPWLLAKVVIGTVVCSLLAPLAVRFFRVFFAQMQAMPKTPGTQPDPAQFAAFFSAIMGFYALFFLGMLLLKAFGTILNDFVLPFYTLEEIPFFEAVKRGLRVMAAEPFHMIGYLLLKLLLAILGGVALYVGLLICMIPLFILVFVVVLIGTALMHAVPGPAGHLLLSIAGVILGILAYVGFLALVLAAMGYLMNVLEAYGIYFMGGRYQRLGDYLEPPTTNYTYAPPPTLPSADERDDDSGDPPLPMDPALA